MVTPVPFSPYQKDTTSIVPLPRRTGKLAHVAHGKAFDGSWMR